MSPTHHRDYFDLEDAALILPPIDSDDLQQEMAILRFQGKRPKRDLVYRRLQSQSGDVWLFNEDTFSNEATLESPWIGTEIREPSPAELLSNWSRDQHPRIQRLIVEFLNDPDDEHLSRTLRVLRRMGIVPRTPRSLMTQKIAESSGSLITLLYQRIKESPQTIDSLYALTRSVHKAKRPEAACRQALRRLMRQNLIQLNLDGITYQMVKGG